MKCFPIMDQEQWMSSLLQDYEPSKFVKYVLISSEKTRLITIWNQYVENGYPFHVHVGQLMSGYLHSKDSAHFGYKHLYKQMCYKLWMEYSTIKRNEILIQANTQMNLKIIWKEPDLNIEHILWLHLYKTSEMQTILTKINPVVVWERREQQDRRGIEEQLGNMFSGDGHIYYLDYSDGFTGVHRCQHLKKLYFFNMCSLLYVNYIPVMLI